MSIQPLIHPVTPEPLQCEPSTEAENANSPQPLPNDRPPVAPFDPELLPECLRDYVCDVADRQQCPPDYVAVVALVALSGILGNKVKAHPKQADNWTVTPNLWGAMIGGPSAMKSPAMKSALAPLYAMEQEYQEEYGQALANYKAEHELAGIDAKAAKAQAIKLHSEGNTAGALEALKSAGREPGQPTRRRLVVNDATVAKLGELLNENPTGLILARDEIAGWLAQMRGEEGQADRAFYLECFDGSGKYTFDRIGRGTIVIESTTLAVIGGIQPSKIAPLVRGAMQGHDDDGLIQRFQLAVFPDQNKRWEWKDRKPNGSAYAAYCKAFSRLSALEPSDTPRRFTPQAQAVFIKWMEEIQALARSGDVHSVMESHIMKMPQTVVGLALIFELVDGGAGAIGERATRKALDFADYLYSHAQRLYAVAANGAATGARLLLKRRDKLPSPFVLRDIQRKGWAGVADQNSIKESVELLCDYGYLRAYEQPPAYNGGRPTQKYRWLGEA